MDLMLNHKAP